MKHLHTYSGCCKYLQQPDFHSLASQIRNRWISVDLAPRISRMLLALACATKLPPEILGRSYCRVICRKMIVSRGNTALWLRKRLTLDLVCSLSCLLFLKNPRILRIIAIQPTKFAQGMSRPKRAQSACNWAPGKVSSPWSSFTMIPSPVISRKAKQGTSQHVSTAQNAHVTKRPILVGILEKSQWRMSRIHFPTQA